MKKLLVTFNGGGKLELTFTKKDRGQIKEYIDKYVADLGVRSLVLQKYPIYKNPPLVIKGEIIK